MSRIIDRAHFMKSAVYFDSIRKKKVGLYNDEVPLPNIIVSFQACGPKNYQFRKAEIKDGKITMVNKVKHKGIPKKTKVSEEDYKNLIILWDKQYNATQSATNYDPKNRSETFKKSRSRWLMNLSIAKRTWLARTNV